MALGRRARLCGQALFLLLAACGAAALATPASESELRNLRGRIEKLQEELAAAEESRGEAAGALRASGRAVSEAQRTLFELSQQRRALEAELEAIAKRDRQLRAEVSEHEALAGRLLRLQYQQGAPDRLRLALEGRDAATVARHIAYYGYIQRTRATLIAELARKREELATLLAQALVQRDALRDNETAQAREARNLEKERSARAAGGEARRRSRGRADRAPRARRGAASNWSADRRNCPDFGEGARGRPVDRSWTLRLVSGPCEPGGWLRLPVSRAG
jgi:septal ring factor EnvC (AmiA/AmiB activator)